MSSKNYHLNIILRIIILFADMLVFNYALQQDSWYVTTTVSGLMMTPMMAYGLIYYVNRYRRDVSNFLLTIQQKDYTRYYKERLNRPEGSSDLDYAFHTIVSELQNVRIDKEAHYHHLKEVIEHTDTGIIS